jgi:hypothetical protein
MRHRPSKSLRPRARHLLARWTMALCAAVALAAAPPARAQVPPAVAPTPDAPGVISGRVFDAVTEEPLGAVTIRVVGQEAATQSDDGGRFTLSGVRPGIVQLEARRLGYAPLLKGDVAVSAGKPVVVTIAMVRAQVQLQAVTVRPSPFPAQPPAATPVSTTSLSSEELRRTPGASEDVVQALSIAPGVATTTAGRNDLFVRGGAAYENLFVVDNIEVPNINHFGTQGNTGGPISLLNIRFIDNATLSAGGFGVRYGDRVSSATSLTLRDGNRERMSGEVNLAASQYGAIVEGPIGEKASFLFNARKSYLDLLFKAFGASFIPSYTDATFKLTWRPSRRDAVSFLTIGAIDRVSFNNDDAEQRVDNSRILAPEQDQYFSGLTWKRLFASGIVTTTLGRTFTRYATAQFDSLTPPTTVFEANTREGENSLRSDVTWQATPALAIDAGNIAKYARALRYDVTIPGLLRVDAAGAPRALRVDTSFSAFRNATYAQATLQATPRLRLTAGVRGDYYDFLDGAFAFSPRGSATLQLDAATTLTLSGGRYHQPPPFIWLVGDPSNRTTLEPLRADQLVVGVQRLVGASWRWQVEGFVKRYANYAARRFRPNAVLQPSGFDNAYADIPFGLEPLTSSGSGRVWGGELLVQKKLDEVPVYAVASLSYNRTSFSGLDGSSTRGAFDTPVIANLVAGWRPNARWEVSGRIRGASGVPVTPFVASGPNAGTLDFTRYNAQRLPAFFSVDVRADRRWRVGGTQLVTFFDIQNVNARENVTGLDWDVRLQRVERNTGLRVLPTIGVNWEF